MACAETDYPPSLKLAAINQSGFNHDNNSFHSMQCDFSSYDFDLDMAMNWSPMSMDSAEPNAAPTLQLQHPLHATDYPQPSTFGSIGNGLNKLDIDPNLLSKVKGISCSEFPRSQNTNGVVDTKHRSAPDTSEELELVTGGEVSPCRASSSRAHEADKPSVASLTKPRRQQRKKKGSMTAAEVQERRDKLLHRNRVAATKCRINRKAHQNKLQDSARKLDGEKQALTVLVNSLKEEALSLKTHILRHANCDCEHIKAYLNREADSLAYSKGLDFRSRSSPVKSDQLASPVAKFLDLEEEEVEDKEEEDKFIQEDD